MPYEVGTRVTIHIPEEFREGPDNVHFGPDGWNREGHGVLINRIMRDRDGDEDAVSRGEFDQLGTMCASLSDGWVWPVGLFSDAPAGERPRLEDCVELADDEAFTGMCWVRKWDGTWQWEQAEKWHYECRAIRVPPGRAIRVPPGSAIALPPDTLPQGTIVHVRASSLWVVVRFALGSEYRTPRGRWARSDIDETYPPGTEVCRHCGKPLELDPCADMDDVCQRCRDECYYECAQCGDVEHVDNMFCHDDDMYCESCWGTVSRACSVCGDRFHRDDLTDGMCESCYDDESDCGSCGEPTTVHSYDYKPDWDFFPDSSHTRYYGVELEIDGVSRDDKRHAGALRACAPDGFLYAKHDGSLPNGFEMVSMPATLDYHMTEANWPDVCAEALELGYRSHDIETCGLHVHISREAFGEGGNQDANIAKLLLLFDMHWEKILRFARRTAAQANDWAKRYSMKRTGDTIEARTLARDAKGKMSRYYAVNLKNDDTVEIRIPRGSLNAQTVLATIQWMDAMVEIVTTTPLADIAGLKWSTMRRTFDRYDHLKAYMARRFDGALMVKDEAATPDPMPDLPDGDEVVPPPAAAYEPGWCPATQDNIREGMRCRLRVPINEVMARVGGEERVWREMNESGDMAVHMNWGDGTCTVHSEEARNAHIIRNEHLEVLIPGRWVAATMENAVAGRFVRQRNDVRTADRYGVTGDLLRQIDAGLQSGKLRIAVNDGSSCPIFTTDVPELGNGVWMSLCDAEVYVTEEN